MKKNIDTQGLLLRMADTDEGLPVPLQQVAMSIEHRNKMQLASQVFSDEYYLSPEQLRSLLLER